METLLHKKHHLFSSASAARTAALPQTLMFWLAHRWALKVTLMVCLVRVHRKEGEAVKELPAMSPASGSSGNLSVVQVCKGSGIMALQWMFLSYSLAFNDTKGQKVLIDTQQTPERLITQPVSSPLPTPLEYLHRVSKFNLQMLIVVLCSTGFFLFRASACTFHLCSADSHNGR